MRSACQDTHTILDFGLAAGLARCLVTALGFGAMRTWVDTAIVKLS
jgi:hypothetical protein